MSRTYLTGDNSRGGIVSGANATFAHLRGWNAGVEVTAGRTEDDRDVFYVTMTGGSNGHSPRKLLGTVTDTPGGPVWEPEIIGADAPAENCGPHAVDNFNQAWCGATPVPASHLSGG